jgi:hypothetical protein
MAGLDVNTATISIDTVTYYKLAKSPQLLAKRIASRDDSSSKVLLQQFP